MKIVEPLKLKMFYSLEHNPSFRKALHPVFSDNRMLDICIKSQEDNEIVTVNRRPRFAKDVGTWSHRAKGRKVAIVMQGPLVADSGFTLETVKIYRKHFPTSTMIVSTWEGEDQGIVRSLKDEGAIVVQNAKPQNPGLSNVNMQIVSSKAGMETAEQNGAEFALKTRTDQRFYAPNTIEFLLNLHQIFPVKGSSSQKGRIIGTSMNTFKYRPYGVSDMFAFGTMADMKRYWSPKLDPREKDSVATKDLNLIEWSKLRMAEVYFSTEFLEAVGRDLKWTLADGWKAHAENFIIIDKESIDLYWHKYVRTLENRHLRYDAIRTDRELTFQEWLLFYQGYLDNIKVPEEVLGYRYGQNVDEKAGNDLEAGR